MTLRNEFGSALTQHIDPSIDLVHQMSTLCTNGSFAAGTWSATVKASESQFEFGAIGTAPVTQALSEIPTSMASGVDHLSALADAMNSASTIGFPFATIVRGAMEAYGRAWYLLEATDAETLIKRWLSTRINDLKFASKASDEPDEELKLRSLMSELKNDATRLGMSADEMTVSFTKLATSFYNDVYQNTGGSREYSILSAVAHAERSGIGRLMQRLTDNVGPGLHSAKLEASDEYISDLAFTALTLHSVLFTKATGHFGIDLQDQGVWGATWANTARTLS